MSYAQHVTDNCAATIRIGAKLMICELRLDHSGWHSNLGGVTWDDEGNSTVSS